ncbi:MAG: CHASE2 domain-containing protein, partial [Pseudohongiella sp.]|nr:CHASE2 domain-containing protein [Pseudohongiella sp.]
MGQALIMSKVRELLQVFNPLSLALRLVPGRGRLVMLGLAGLISLMVFALFNNSLRILEERLGAQGWLLAPQDQPEERVTIVAIDEQSLAEIGPWPWSRTDMARLTLALNAAGVQLQIHDIVYPEQREGDEAFIAALQASRGAVISQQPVIQSNQQVQTGLMTHALSGVSCDAS